MELSPKTADSSFEEGLSQHLFAIINTKIKYTEFVMNQKIQEHSEKENLSAQSKEFTQSDVLLRLADNREKEEQLLKSIEQFSHRMSVLLKIRRSINEENNELVYYLLNEDNYLLYSLESLENMLKLEEVSEVENKDAEEVYFPSRVTAA